MECLSHSTRFMQVVIEKDRGAADETTNAGFLLEVRVLVECNAF